MAKKGSKLSLETRQKMSDAAKGRPLSEKQKAAHAKRKETRRSNPVRTCPKCGIEKELLAFPKKGKHRDGRDRYGYCKLCHSAYQKVGILKRFFNLTLADLATIENYQGGVCAICKRPPKTKRLSIDHRHKDGLIRGCVCWKCNRALGLVQDNIEFVKNMLKYLQTPPATLALKESRYGRPGRVSSKKGYKFWDHTLNVTDIK